MTFETFLLQIYLVRNIDFFLPRSGSDGYFWSFYFSHEQIFVPCTYTQELKL